MASTHSLRGRTVKAGAGYAARHGRDRRKRGAETGRPLLVHETGLPVRYYIPPQDVDLALFQPTDIHTTCPYKGVASYWSYGEHTDGPGPARSRSLRCPRSSTICPSATPSPPSP
ncbi:DUF427 domain-containing protein [Streptomyces sp. NPDC056161]|uniref:DUF427 domain-containing protein n=1 Tax=Streptomyces sp. NPDC056161 TaxID=3345732 RepID=UPI0035D83DD5